MKGSPFKLKSQSSEGSGTIFSKYMNIDFDTNLGKVSTKPIQGEGKELNNVEGKTTVFDESSKAATVADQVKVAKAGKSKGGSAFDRDGRSVDKFDQRIADAESKGKLGRVQRLKNRKGGYMESQANKLEKAGGTLSDQQKTDLNKAGKEAKGTRVGRALRVLGNREAKERKVDPVAATSVSGKNNALTTGSSSSKSKSLGNNFMNNKPDFRSVTKSTNVSTGYDKYVAGKTAQEKKEGIDTAEMFYNKKPKN
tara:strand:- start:296 stop:1054 length:759 start_codon:yes stop_codon:yes gene_type:complete